MTMAFTEQDAEHLLHLHRQGMSVRQLARFFGLTEPQAEAVIQRQRERERATPRWWQEQPSQPSRREQQRWRGRRDGQRDGADAA